MTHEEAFLQAIIENPEDDTPRLVYADWLEDRGDQERAEFIRVQCELSGMAVFNDHRRELQARQQDFLATHGAKWLRQEWPQAANPAVNAQTFVRGFVAVLSFSGRNLNYRGVRALVSPKLAFVTSLDLRDNRVGAGALKSLADSPYVAGLTFLDLRENPFPVASLRVLAFSRHLTQLRELLVPANLVTEGVRMWFRRGREHVAVRSE